MPSDSRQSVEHTETVRDVSSGAGKSNDWTPIATQLAGRAVTSVNNFDGDRMNQYRLMQIACGPNCGKFEDGKLNTIRLKYFFAHNVELEARTGGELVDAVRVVLMDEDGKCIGFVSDFLARELDNIISIFGRGPWSPPIPLEIVKAQSARKMNFYTVRPIIE